MDLVDAKEMLCLPDCGCCGVGIEGRGANQYILG